VSFAHVARRKRHGASVHDDDAGLHRALARCNPSRW
jgi:hypothetical protein